jgi:nucleoside 2-deoxyribosyltransferase
MLTVVGGTYLEFCEEPHSRELYGSGLRGAIALSNHIPEIKFESCVGIDKARVANIICSTFGINASFVTIPQTVLFGYYHPLAQPLVYPDISNWVKVKMPNVIANNILLYGQIEAEVKVNGSFVVYDPQNWISFKDTGSTAQKLALVLNRNEALLISKLPEHTDLSQVAIKLLETENADVVVIKNGSRGAFVVDETGSYTIPVFKTGSVWPIGSGDIFSAVFAWKWAIEKKQAKESAYWASRFTAQYCNNRLVPLPMTPTEFPTATSQSKSNTVYLAGPFFTMADRWLINELRDKLLEFGNKVFSPFHDVGFGTPQQVVDKDLSGIQKADIVLAVANGIDAGTIYEIGYARAIGKKVVVLAENVTDSDLTMMIGSECEITNDFSTAIYKVSW